MSGDHGASFVELLVSIVLLGTIVVATLTALRTSIVSSEIDQHHARAYAWLQAASDEVNHTTYLPCHSNAISVIESGYQSAVDGATRPNEWATATITVVSVQLLSRSGDVDLWGTACASGDPESPVTPQLVSITVASPDGEFTATVQVIKRG